MTPTLVRAITAPQYLCRKAVASGRPHSTPMQDPKSLGHRIRSKSRVAAAPAGRHFELCLGDRYSELPHARTLLMETEALLDRVRCLPVLPFAPGRGNGQD